MRGRDPLGLFDDGARTPEVLNNGLSLSRCATLWTPTGCGNRGIDPTLSRHEMSGSVRACLRIVQMNHQVASARGIRRLVRHPPEHHGSRRGRNRTAWRRR